MLNPEEIEELKPLLRTHEVYYPVRGDQVDKLPEKLQEYMKRGYCKLSREMSLGGRTGNFHYVLTEAGRDLIRLHIKIGELLYQYLDDIEGANEEIPNQQGGDDN